MTRGVLPLAVAGLVLVCAACGVRSAPSGAAQPSGSSTAQPSGPGVLVTGVVDARPGCPVERPGHPCNPRPVAGALIEARPLPGRPGARVAARARTRADGRYAVRVSPGRYLLVVGIRQILPRCAAVTVTVTAGHPVRADIHCDSGIR